MRTACGDQAVAIVPMKALRLGLSPWSFRVLCELFTVPKTDGFWCILYNSIDKSCFLPLANRTKKALTELTRCGIITILKRLDEGFAFEIHPESAWQCVVRKTFKKSDKSDA